jgi:hypothetical protein
MTLKVPKSKDLQRQSSYDCRATYFIAVMNGTNQRNENRTYGLPEVEAVDIPGQQ